MYIYIYIYTIIFGTDNIRRRVFVFLSWISNKRLFRKLFINCSAGLRQLVYEKENSEFKPVKLRLKIDLMSYPARAEGLVNMINMREIILSSGLRIRWLDLPAVGKTFLAFTIKRDELDLTLNCICFCGSASEALWNVEYPFVAITQTRVVVPVSVTSMGKIDQFYVADRCNTNRFWPCRLGL